MDPHTPTLLERDAELDALTMLVRDVGEGHGRLATIQGPAGIGKTRLLEVACTTAERTGARILGARGSPLEAEFAFGGVRQLLELPVARLGAADREQLVAGPASLAAGVFGYGPAEGGPLGIDPSFPVLTGLFRLVASLAGTAPLVLAVDDAQWLDRPSLRFLDFLSRRVEELAVIVMITCRSGEGVLESSLSGLTSDARGRHLWPAPLSVAAATELVRAGRGPDADDRFCEACHGVTAGNPFLLHELLGELARAGIAPRASEATRLRTVGPRAVATAIRHRLARLSPDAGTIARAVAVLGDDAEPAQAAALADLGETAAADAARELADVQILRHGMPLGFVHATVRAAVESELSPTERDALHGRAARTLLELGAPPEQVAAHLLAVAGDAQAWVVEVLRNAATGAIARGAVDGGVAYLRRALSEPPPASTRTEVLRELGQAELRLGDLAAISHLEEALAGSRDPEQRAETARALTTTVLMSGDAARALEVIEEVVTTLRARSGRLARRLDAELSAQAWFLMAHTEPDHELRAPALARLERFGEQEPTSPAERLARATLAFSRCQQSTCAAQAAEHAEGALAGGRLLAEVGPEPSVFYGLINALIVADRLDVAESSLCQALQAANARGAALAWVPSVWLSHVGHHRGNMAVSEEGAREGLEQLAIFGWPVPTPIVLSYLVDALRERGRLSEADGALSEHGATAEIAPGMLQDHLLASRGRLRIAQGRPDEGVSDLTEFGRRHDIWGAANPNALRDRSHMAIGLAALGATADARRCAAEDHRRARRWGTPRAIGTALHACGCVENGERAVKLLERAARTLERSPARLEFAHALVDLGSALRRHGHRADSRPPLRRGLQLADGCGAIALADRALDELAATGVHPRRRALTGVGALTPSEHRVALLAAAGRTNLEIARTLFVTRKTVEAHLTHSYRKLAIRTRTQLAQAIGEAGRPG